MLKVKENEVHEILKGWFPKDYMCSNIDINIDGGTKNGTLYGDDECWDTYNGFYQYFVIEDGEGWAQVYQVFYDTTDEDGNELQDLGCVDYDKPQFYKDCTHIFAFASDVEYKEE